MSVHGLSVGRRGGRHGRRGGLVDNFSVRVGMRVNLGLNYNFDSLIMSVFIIKMVQRVK